MADVVRSGAIFRVRNTTAMRSPFPILPGMVKPKSRIADATPEPTSAKKLKRTDSSTSKSTIDGSSITTIKESDNKSTQSKHKKHKSHTVDLKKGTQVPFSRQHEKETSRQLKASVDVINFDNLIKRSPMPRYLQKASKETNVHILQPKSKRLNIKDEGSSMKTNSPLPLPPKRSLPSKKRLIEQVTPTESKPQQTKRLEGGIVRQERRRIEETPPIQSQLSDKQSHIKRQRSEPEDEPIDDEVREKIVKEVEIQKRLLFVDTPQSKKEKRSSTKPMDSCKPKTSTAPVKKRVRRENSSVQLKEWFLQWPPQYMDHELEIVLCGQVDDQVGIQSFVLDRRITSNHFISNTRVHVELTGCLDIEQAQEMGVPPHVVAIMVEGIPARLRQQLIPYVPRRKSSKTEKSSHEIQVKEQASMSPLKTVKVKRKTSTQPHARIPQREPKEGGSTSSIITKAIKKKSSTEPRASISQEELKKKASTPSITTNTIKKKALPKTHASVPQEVLKDVKNKKPKLSKPVSSELLPVPLPKHAPQSRSGRRLTPVMEWWRNERKVTNMKGETYLITGSPPELPSRRKMDQNTLQTTITAIHSQQRKEVEWTKEQLEALEDATINVPTTTRQFWIEVAKHVPGKTATECQAQSFASFSSPSQLSKAKNETSTFTVPTKLYRKGSNMFKKQVRTFVNEYEKTHVDDLFADQTPTKSDLSGTMELDDLQSPGIVGGDSVIEMEDGNKEEEDNELLEKVSMQKRDEVDSYVLSLKRSHGVDLGRRAHVAHPKTNQKQLKRVCITSEWNDHVLEGQVSPGGTTQVVKLGDDHSDEWQEEEDDDDGTLSCEFN